MQRSQGFEYGVTHFLSPKSGQLSAIVSECCQISQAEAEFLLRLGAIYIQNERAQDDLQILEGIYLRVHTKPRRFHVEFSLQSDLLFENEEFAVVHKPSGSPCHASVDNQIENLHRVLEEKLNTKLYVTTRLDVPTEGALIYAKTREFLTEYNLLAQKQNLQKKYLAAVSPLSALEKLDFSQALLLEHYLEASPKAPKIVKAEKTLDSDLLCQLKILSRRDVEDESHLKIALLTGRTHQIRAQLSFLGAPVVGDAMYGSPVTWKKEKIKLTATDLKFRLEDGRGFEFQTKARWGLR